MTQISSIARYDGRKPHDQLCPPRAGLRSTAVAVALLATFLTGHVSATDEYEILDFQDLGTLGSTGGTEAADINDLGQVVGSGFTAGGYMHGFLWENGQIHTIGGMFWAGGINNLGEIVGQLELPPYQDPAAQWPFNPDRAALHRNGVTTNLGSLDDDDPYSGGYLSAINNNSTMVGTASAGRDANGINQPYRAVFSNGSGLAVLGGVGPSDKYSEATDINDAGQIVGQAHDSNNITRAYLRQPAGLVIDVSPPWALYSFAHAINAQGDLVGRGDSYAFVRYSDGSGGLLPNAIFAVNSEAYDINDAGMIVGSYRDSSLKYNAFFHDGQNMVDLTALASAYMAQAGQPGIFRLTSATAINNSNKIVGVGKYRDSEGDEYWERSFIMTIAKKPPAILVHDVNILGEPHGFVAGATVRLIRAGETIESLTSGADGRAVLPAGLDLIPLTTVEITYDPGMLNGVPREVKRSYELVRLDEVADGMVQLALPLTLRDALDVQFKKLESPGTFVLPYQTFSARNLFAQWNSLNASVPSVHQLRDHSGARMLATADGLSQVYGKVEELSIDTAKVLCETLLGLTALKKAQSEALEELESDVAAEVASSLLSSDAARFAISCMVIAAQNATSVVQKSFIATLKTVAPGTAADLVDEALKVATKGIASGLESGAWDKKKGIDGARGELLKDIATKITSEVGGRVFASAHVLATQDELASAVSRTEFLEGSSSVLAGRNAVLIDKVGEVDLKVNDALSLSLFLDDTSKGFDWVADLAAVVGRIPPAKIATAAASIIKGMNVVMSATAAGNDIDTLLEVSNTDTTDICTHAFFPPGGSGGESFAAAPPVSITPFGGIPGNLVLTSSPATDAYAAALTATEAAAATGIPATIVSAGDILLTEDSALEAVCDATAERLAGLAAAAAPADPYLAAAGESLGTARRAFAIAKADLYPALAGLVVPSIADPDMTPAILSSRFSAVTAALAEIETALVNATAATNGMVLPARLVMNSHGLANGATGCRPGAITLSARVLNPGDSATGSIAVTFAPTAISGPVAPLHLTSPATVNLPGLAAGASALVEWQAVATDVSPSGNGGSAEYAITATAAGLDPVTAEGAVGINGSGGLRFEEWIDGTLGAGEPRGFTEDADGDGIDNSLERFLGRNPGAGDPSGLALVADAGGAVLRHTRTSNPGPDVSAHYEWSPNLVDWRASGESIGATSVVMNPVVVAGEGNTSKDVDVTLHATGETSTLFFRLRLDQDSPPPAAPAPLAAPTITTGADSPQFLFYGDPLTLAVTAAGTGPLFFQWLKDDVEITGADDSTFIIPAVSNADTGIYRVRVTGSTGTILSPPYEVTVSGGGGG